MAEPVTDAMVDAALDAVARYWREAHAVLQAYPSRGLARVMLEAAVPLIGAAVAAAERQRAEAAEAVIAEVREVIGTYFTVHGNNTAASLARARDLAEGIRQVLDRTPLETQERGGEKGTAT